MEKGKEENEARLEVINELIAAEEELLLKIEKIRDLRH